MDARTVAGALAHAARAANQLAGPQTATALVRAALTVLSDEEVEAVLRAAMLPDAVVMALEHDERELAAVLAAERLRAS
ncbi:MAG: hypothetical protein ACRDTT_26220 [Pseudonocardiaceae bacterium]